MFEELNTLLSENKYQDFIRNINEMNTIDSAEYLSTVAPENLPKVLRLLKKDKAAEIFAELESDVQEMIIISFSDRELSAILNELYIDDVMNMLDELPASIVNKILKNADKQKRAEINRFLKYEEDSAGSVMTSEFVRIRSNMTVSEAVEYIRKTGAKKETVYVIYVTDATRVLKGTVGLRDLLFAQDYEIISDIMNEAVISALTTDDRESVAMKISKYDLLALPIVDSEERLVGIVTVDDALDVIEEEATEDIERMAAMAPSDKPYLKTGVFEIFKNRIPWLLLLMISSTVTSAIISHYEAALASMVILTSFIPMLMGTGGNAGSQSSVTIIRGISLDEIKMGNIFKVLFKELRVSILCGAVLAIATFIKVILIDRASVAVSFVVALTLLAAIIVAKLVGCSLPILAKRLGFDPAVMASPFITTIIDAVTLILYFAIASSLLLS
ncbi:MAG: magnesium transporter [Clostridia bacterium]|nr:magnesium transporter [Clostridia bacterium]